MNTYNCIGKHRTELMGFAMIVIMFFHMNFSVPSQFGILSFIKQTGYGGVDIFLFLSGYGIYHSLKKNSSLLGYYKRRAVRIFLHIFRLYSFIRLFILYSEDSRSNR